MRKKDSEQSRLDILEAAEIEFAAKGLYRTRIDEIAVRANVNKRMIYEYLGNKEQLYTRRGFTENSYNTFILDYHFFT